MRKRASAAVLLVTLGGAASFATLGSADPPRLHVPRATVTVHERSFYRGHSAGYWHLRAVQARALASQRSRALRRSAARTRRLTLSLRRRWAPTVRYALRLARAVYGYDQSRRVHCESRGNPLAAEGHGPLGLLQFLPSTWTTTPFASFSIFDPVAASLAGGWMIQAGRSGEWSCPL